MVATTVIQRGNYWYVVYDFPHTRGGVSDAFRTEEDARRAEAKILKMLEAGMVPVAA